jgi:hypothetical protein
MRLRLAILTTVFCSAATALYAATDAEPMPALGWFLGAGPLVMVILWLHQDARQRHIAAVHDLGFFLMVFWPVVIPWFAFKSRGQGAGSCCSDRPR